METQKTLNTSVISAHVKLTFMHWGELQQLNTVLSCGLCTGMGTFMVLHCDRALSCQAMYRRVFFIKETHLFVLGVWL